MRSEEYWYQREAEARGQNIRNEEAYKRKLMQYYDSLQDSIQKEIDAFYGKYATKEGITLSEAKRRADKIDIEAYARKAKKYVESHDLSKEANDEMRLYNLTMKVNRLELLKANIGLEMIKTYDELGQYYEDMLDKETLDNYKRLSGILGYTISDVEKRAKAIVNASFKGATFSENLWAYQTELKSQLSTLLTQGLVTGKGSRQLASQLAKHFDAQKYHAERLMRTELSRVRMDSQIDSFREAGYRWYKYLNFSSAAFAGGPICADCKRINGRHFKVENFLPGTNAPPMHPNCRCSIAAAEPRTEEQEMEWLNEANHIKEGMERQKLSEAPSKESVEIIDYTARREARLAARRKKPNFENMDGEALCNFAENNLKTKFDVPKGTNTKGLREAVKVIHKFEEKMGGTIDGLSVKFTTGLKGVYAKYDDKTKTLLLPKGANVSKAEQSMRDANVRYRAKWKKDKDYYATETFSGTIWHELGHAVDVDTGQRLSMSLGNDTELYIKAVKVSSYAGTQQNVRVTKASEAWAENFAAYMDGGKNAAKVPREVGDAINQYFDENLNVTRYNKKKKAYSRSYKNLSEEEFVKLKGECTAAERKIIYGRLNKGYIASGEAKHINEDLRAGVKLSEHRQKVTDVLRKVISKNTINEDIEVFRLVGDNAFSDITGVEKFEPSLKKTKEEYWNWFESIPKNVPEGRVYNEKAFMSTSAVIGKNVFGDRATVLKIKVPKGTHGYVTTNKRESEVIFDRPSLRIIKVEVDKSKKLKIIHAIIEE